MVMFVADCGRRALLLPTADEKPIGRHLEIIVGGHVATAVARPAWARELNRSPPVDAFSIGQPRATQDERAARVERFRPLIGFAISVYVGFEGGVGEGEADKSAELVVQV